MGYLTLEAAQAWKALGGPQRPEIDCNDPGASGYAHVWLIPQPDWDFQEPILAYGYTYDDGEFRTPNYPDETHTDGQWVAAPDDTTALNWLHHERAWSWEYRSFGLDPTCYLAQHIYSGAEAFGRTPSALILAIAAKMQEAKHGASIDR